MALLHLHGDVIDLLFGVGAELTELEIKMYKQYEVLSVCFTTLYTLTNTVQGSLEQWLHAGPPHCEPEF